MLLEYFMKFSGIALFLDPIFGAMRAPSSPVTHYGPKALVTHHRGASHPSPAAGPRHPIYQLT